MAFDSAIPALGIEAYDEQEAKRFAVECAKLDAEEQEA
jgi:hypothetical protein